MAKKSQHVVPLGGGWAVKSSGSQKATVITSKQSDAISYARDLAKKQKGELVIHGKDGKIREKNSYRADSYPTKG